MKFTLLYPGQGSQQPGMGRFLYDNFSVAREVFQEASDAINTDLKKLCFDGSEADLALTENTQPCLLTVSTAADRVLKKEFGIEVLAAAGHSIGEYAAVVSAQALSLWNATKAVRIRGQAMQSAVPVGQGGMIATLGLDEVQVDFLCRWTMEQSGFSPVEPANFNSPGQIVISGSQKALNWLKENFKAEILPGEAKRPKLIPLQVSAPFHCSMMKPAEEKMAEVLSAMEFTDAQFPIVQNVHAQAVVNSAELRTNLIRQVSAPVKWIQCVQHLKSLGAKSCIEVGHGQVIKGLVKKIDSETLNIFNINSLDELKALEGFIKEATKE